jgi:hypothetical protein
MQQMQLGMMLLGDARGTLYCPLGKRRKIGGGNDTADAGHGGFLKTTNDASINSLLVEISDFRHQPARIPTLLFEQCVLHTGSHKTLEFHVKAHSDSLMEPPISP